MLDYPIALPLNVHIFAMPFGRLLPYLLICHGKLFEGKRLDSSPHPHRRLCNQRRSLNNSLTPIAADYDDA